MCLLSMANIIIMLILFVSALTQVFFISLIMLAYQ